MPWICALDRLGDGCWQQLCNSYGTWYAVNFMPGYGPAKVLSISYFNSHFSGFSTQILETRSEASFQALIGRTP